MRYRGRGTRGPAAVCVLALGLLAAATPAAAAAQEPAPDTADRRAGSDTLPPPPPEPGDTAAAVSGERPPNSHPFDGWDAVALPFRLATFPIKLVGDGVHLLLDAAVKSGVDRAAFGLHRRAVRWGLQPGVGSIGPRSGPAARLTFRRFEPFYLSTAFSLREYQHHEAGLRWDGDPGVLEVAGGFDRDAEPHFFGLGPGTPESDRSSYLRDRVFGRVGGTLRPPGPVDVTGRIGYEENRVAPGFDDAVPAVQDGFDADDLFGLGPEKDRFFSGTLEADLDGVEVEDLSMHGAGLTLGASVFRGAGPTDADFHRFRGVARAFVPVNGRQLVALRADAEVNRGDSGRGVPFYHMADLGDDTGGRAYSDQRFRAQDRVSGTVEWRYEIWRELHDSVRMEGFLFGEEGTVERRLDEIGTSDWRPSFGAGLRLVGGGGEIGHLYWAVGEEGSRVQFDVGTSF